MTAEQLSREFGIALSGGVATGKSVVSALLRDMGHPVIDADMLARDAVTPKSPALLLIIALDLPFRFLLKKHILT